MANMALWDEAFEAAATRQAQGERQDFSPSSLVT
jgi:hypothetical protein